MIADRNRIFDGWLSLEGGVDAGRVATLIDVNQAESAENMTFRGGRATTRPGFRKLNETLVNPLQCCYREVHFNPTNNLYSVIGEYAGEQTMPLPSYFETAQTVYRTGILQSAIVYNPHHGDDCIMAMISGRLFKIVPRIADAIVTEIAPIKDDSSPESVDRVKNSLPPLYLRNRDDLPLAYMVQADKWLIVQDGSSKAIIYDSVNARRSVIEAPRDKTEVPTGTIMAFGMGRIVVVVNEKDIAFGDLYGSHALPDAGDSIIFFTERNFLAEGFDAAIPFQQGIVTGLSFFPQLDTSTGTGQLLAFAENGANAFFLSLPREQWKTSQFQIFALLTTGLRGHRSVAVVNEDLWFRANDGVRSYRQARSEPSGWAHIPLSTNVSQFMDEDTSWLLKYISTIYFDNRIIMTCSPMWNQGRPVHGGVVVVDFDILSSFGTNNRPAWEGHWSFPQDIKISQLISGKFNGTLRAFAFGVDSDGNNQLYEISLNDSDDWDDQHIEWELVSRAFDFQKLSQQSSPFSEVELYDGDIWLEGIIE